MSDLPKAIWQGVLSIGGVDLEVSVLDDGRRIIGAEGFERLMSGETQPLTEADAKALAEFLNGATP